jgi:hypothetical protein
MQNWALPLRSATESCFVFTCVIQSVFVNIPLLEYWNKSEIYFYGNVFPNVEINCLLKYTIMCCCIFICFYRCGCCQIKCTIIPPWITASHWSKVKRRKSFMDSSHEEGGFFSSETKDDRRTALRLNLFVSRGGLREQENNPENLPSTSACEDDFCTSVTKQDWKAVPATQLFRLGVYMIKRHNPENIFWVWVLVVVVSAARKIIKIEERSRGESWLFQIRYYSNKAHNPENSPGFHSRWRYFLYLENLWLQKIIGSATNVSGAEDTTEKISQTRWELSWRRLLVKVFFVPWKPDTTQLNLT